MLPPDTLTQAAGPVLRGALVRPGDAGYEELRLVHNARVDRRPAMIAQVADADDVAAALAHARAHALPVSVRGGGHASTGHAIADGGVVVDVRGLEGITVRVASRTIRAGGGVTWGELDAAAQAHGLAVTGARAPSVGVVGFTTGSGSGWLERVMGLAADNLRSAEVVTADGRLVTASETENPDLFWALRGGGGNFGVVTEMTFRAMPLGPTVVGGMRLFEIERAREVMTAYRDAMLDAPDALCGGLAILHAPPAPHVPAELHGRPVVGLVALWAGDPEDAWSGLEPLDALGTPVVDQVGPMPYTALQSLLGPKGDGPAPPMRHYQKFALMDTLTASAIDTLAALGDELPTPQSAIILHPLGGAFGRTAEGATALGGRTARWGYQLLTGWPDARDDAPNIAWTRAAAAEMADHAFCAPWPNFVCDDDRRRLAVPYAPATLARLREVKRAWDPDNVFRSCHNVAPD